MKINLKLIKKAGVRTVLLKDWQPRLFDVAVERRAARLGWAYAQRLRPRGTLVLKALSQARTKSRWRLS
jgi:hypothetical protein